MELQNGLPKCNVTHGVYPGSFNYPTSRRPKNSTKTKFYQNFKQRSLSIQLLNFNKK